MNKTQFIQAILTAQSAISNQVPALTQVQAQTQFATAVGNAIDTYMNSTGESTRVNSMKTQMLALINEMQKQSIAIGTNLNSAVLENILENVNDI